MPGHLLAGRLPPSRYLLGGLMETRTAPNPPRLRSLGVIVADLRAAWAAAGAQLSGPDSAPASSFAGVG